MTRSWLVLALCLSVVHVMSLDILDEDNNVQILGIKKHWGNTNTNRHRMHAKYNGQGIANSVLPVYIQGASIMTGAVTIYPVFYGDWTVGANVTAKAKIVTFLSNVAQVPAIQSTGFYYQNISGTVTYASPNSLTTATGCVVATGGGGVSNANSLSGNDIKLLITGCITSQWGGGNGDVNGIYFVITTNNVADGVAGKEACGWHSAWTPNGVELKYGIVVDPSANTGSSCNVHNGRNDGPSGSLTADSIIDTLVHEIGETITDPSTPGAWPGTGSQGEDGDVCDHIYGTLYTAGSGNANQKVAGVDYLTQSLWLPAYGGFCSINCIPPNPASAATQVLGTNCGLQTTGTLTSPDGQTVLSIAGGILSLKSGGGAGATLWNPSGATVGTNPAPVGNNADPASSPNQCIGQQLVVYANGTVAFLDGACSTTGQGATQPILWSFNPATPLTNAQLQVNNAGTLTLVQGATTIMTWPSSVSGDPQLNGFHGQSFQIHGFPDEIMNLVTMSDFQWHSMFVYLDGENRIMTRKHYNHTARYTHPGTYLGELFFTTPSANIHIRAGSHEKGMTVLSNGHVIPPSKHGMNISDLEVHVLSKDRVMIKSRYLSITVDNSDWFVNIGVYQRNLIQSRACDSYTTRTTPYLSSDDMYNTECTLTDVRTGELVQMHGLIGGTYRNVKFAHGRLYEGEPDDYRVSSGAHDGTDFLFNLYQKKDVQPDDEMMDLSALMH